MTNPPRDYADDYEPESPRQAMGGALFFGGVILGLFIGLIL